ncbi:BadF/BadG/BcrA/BcrD ATPase family protein [Pukyongiella litopenaei]|uniref:ATPase n=1 Tax=Pukyongiella litopenaei TaxID=2605946 RepID=A0A2S0MRR9_9RHOB|nr:BadF/BadG/BcrA/BcrD ATPase family protein [Pukyongiella litopenaei]AVO38588.1 ATPase [Pukyongiella litopenaei]
MQDSTPNNVIGVDGGGTSCRAALVLDGQRHEVQAGAANATTDLDGTIRTLRDALAQLRGATGISGDRLQALPAYLGLAGVLDPRTGDRIAAALNLSRAQVGDDRRTTVTGALGGGDGAVAGLGTGSFMARQTGDRLRLIGGYGLTMGDEASGAWLGRGLLSHTLHALDGLIPHCPLTDAIAAEFGDAVEIVRFASTAGAADFAGLAPRVIAAAENGDATALTLMRAGARYVEQGLHAMGWQPAEPVCLTGGVGPHYAPYLADDIANALRDPAGTALDGALRLAAGIGDAP